MTYTFAMPLGNDKPKKTVRKVVLDYSTNATFHGVQYVFSPDTATSRRSVASCMKISSLKLYNYLKIQGLCKNRSGDQVTEDISTFWLSTFGCKLYFNFKFLGGAIIWHSALYLLINS